MKPSRSSDSRTWKEKPHRILVRGWVRGDFGVRRRELFSEFILTHIPSGRLVARFHTLEDAKKCADSVRKHPGWKLIPEDPKKSEWVPDDLREIVIKALKKYRAKGVE